MKLDDNDLPIESRYLLDPLELWSAKVKGIGFQSVSVPCPDGTIGVQYFILLFSADKQAMTFTLDGSEVMQAINNPDLRAEWRQKVIAEAIAWIQKVDSEPTL